MLIEREEAREFGVHAGADGGLGVSGGEVQGGDAQGGDEELQMSTTLFTFASCPTINLRNSFRSLACPSFDETMKFILENRPTYLVLASAISPYLIDENCPLRENLECATTREDRINDWFKSFESFTTDMQKIKQKVIFIVQTPYLIPDSRGLSIVHKVLNISNQEAKRTVMAEQKTFERRTKEIANSKKYLAIVYPTRTICQNSNCDPETQEQRKWFRDGGHLSKAGSLQLAIEIKLAIQKLEP